MLRKIWSRISDFVGTAMKDNIGIYAAYASFFIIISAIPFAMLLLSFVKFFVPAQANSDLMMNGIRALAPESIYEFLQTVVDEILNRSSMASIVSATVITTLWSASKGVMGLYQGLNNVHKPEKPLNYIQARALSVVYTIVFIFVLLLTIIVFGFGNWIETILRSRLPVVAAVINEILNARIIIFTIILTFSFAMMYKVLPRKKIKFKSQLPGAFVAAVGWMLFTHAYSVYIENFSNYSYVYGSLTAVVLLMLWLFFCMNIFLLGAELNMIYEDFFKNKFNI